MKKLAVGAFVFLARLTFVALYLTALTGCAARQSTITNLPAGVSQAEVQSWDSAVANLNKIAIATTNLRQAVIQLHGSLDANGQSAFPSGPAYISTLEVIGKIDQIENSASVFLGGVPNNWTQGTKQQVTSYVSQISALIQQLNSEGVTAIKNANSQNQVNVFIKEITSAVTIILSL